MIKGIITNDTYREKAKDIYILHLNSWSPQEKNIK